MVAQDTIDESAKTRWDNLDNAFSYYQGYLDNKKNIAAIYELTVLDLVFIANFKGGNASITENEHTLREKLKLYSSELAKIHRQFASQKLSNISTLSLKNLIEICNNFVSLTIKPNTKIKGFGPSYASALLAAHFPDLIPILDRRIINGLEIEAEINKSGQIKEIDKYYGLVIENMYNLAVSAEYKALSLREIDKILFSKTMNK